MLKWFLECFFGKGARQAALVLIEQHDEPAVRELNDDESTEWWGEAWMLSGLYGNEDKNV